MIPLLQDGKQQVYDHCYPYLGLYCIWAGPIKGLDSEILFDPLKEQFDFPASLVEGSDCFGGKHKAVGQENQGPALSFISKTDPS